MIGALFVAVLIGLLAGLIAALCGVGGGLIMVPAMVYFLGLSQREAIATSLGSIVLIAMAGTLRNSQNQLVNWPVAISSALAGALIAWFAADWIKHLSNESLSRIFSILLIVMGIKMWFSK